MNAFNDSDPLQMVTVSPNQLIRFPFIESMVGSGHWIPPAQNGTVATGSAVGHVVVRIVRRALSRIGWGTTITQEIEMNAAAPAEANEGIVRTVLERREDHALPIEKRDVNQSWPALPA